MHSFSYRWIFLPFILISQAGAAELSWSCLSPPITDKELCLKPTLDFLKNAGCEPSEASCKLATFGIMSGVWNCKVQTAKCEESSGFMCPSKTQEIGTTNFFDEVGPIDLSFKGQGHGLADLNEDIKAYQAEIAGLKLETRDALLKLQSGKLENYKDEKQLREKLEELKDKQEMAEEALKATKQVKRLSLLKIERALATTQISYCREKSSGSTHRKKNGVGLPN